MNINNIESYKKHIKFFAFTTSECLYLQTKYSSTQTIPCEFIVAHASNILINYTF